jgi:hypothetical protein
MSYREEFGVDTDRAIASAARFTFDSKSHKLARRLAGRDKRNRQESLLRDDSADTVTLSRKLRRYATLGALLAMVALSAPHAFAWGSTHGGAGYGVPSRTGATYHGKASAPHGSSARTSFRSAVTGN